MYKLPLLENNINLPCSGRTKALATIPLHKLKTLLGIFSKGSSFTNTCSAIAAIASESI